MWLAGEVGTLLCVIQMLSGLVAVTGSGSCASLVSTAVGDAWLSWWDSCVLMTN